MMGQDYGYMQTFNTRDGLPSNNISGLEQDSRGLLWIATWNGLCCFDGYRFTTFRSPDDGHDMLTTNRIDKIRIDSADNIRLYTHDNHFYIFDTHTCRYQQLPKGMEADINYPADHLLKTNATSGHGWQISSDSRLLLDKSVTLVGNTDNIMPKIEHHFIDRQQNLWFNSPKGLSRLTIRQQRTQFIGVRPGERVRSVCCRRDGSVWAGTMEGYIAIFDAATHLRGWLSTQGRIVSNSVRFSRQIYALFEDSQNRLWIGTKGDGLYIIDAQGRMTHHTPDPTNRYSISSPEIYDIDEDAAGNIWIASFTGGVNVVQPADTLRFIHAGNDLKQYPRDAFLKVRRVTHTADGLIIASATSGLLTIDAATTGDWRKATIRTFCHEQGNATSLRTNDVMQVLAGSNGSIYVATLGGGIQQVTLSSLRSGKPQFTWSDELNTLVGNVQSLTQDQQGRIWISREMVIECFQPQNNHVIRYGVNSMAGETEMAEALSATDANGNIYLPANNGIVTFSPHKMQTSQYRPDIAFTGLLFQGERIVQPLLYRPSLTLDRQQRSLAITFAALDYNDNDLIQYAYRMDGNEQWNYIGSTPRISFNDLTPGRHTLTVKSTNSDGVWTDNETRLVINVTPTFWELRWVQAGGMILLILLTTWGLMRYLRHRQHEREREQRLENILRQYRELSSQQAATNGEKYSLAEPVIPNPDEAMMNQLMDYIEQHLDDENLKIEQMAQAVGLSRTVLYGKIKQLMGVSPSDFLRQVRMQRAEQLVAKSRMSISEVAYAVGFSDPKYFTKCFKKQTGLTPSEYRNQTKTNDIV